MNLGTELFDPVVVPAGMNAVGQKDHDQRVDRIGPNRCPRKPQMAKAGF